MVAWALTITDLDPIRLGLLFEPETFQEMHLHLRHRATEFGLGTKDLAADGVVYAEVRYAPELSTQGGLTLDEVAERTKIPVPILHSLELDEYHKISGPLYVNSFLRTYAADVGVDPARVLDLYARFSGEVVAGASEPEAPAVWTEEEVTIQRVGLPWVRIGLAAVLIVVPAVRGIAGVLGSPGLKKRRLRLAVLTTST